jgi:hypothetical protein
METIYKATGVEQGAGLANTDASGTPRQTLASGHRSFVDSLSIHLNIHCEKARAKIYSRKKKDGNFGEGRCPGNALVCIRFDRPPFSFPDAKPWYWFGKREPGEG